MSIITHSLGIGHGSLIEDTDDGTVSYRATGTLIPKFSVRIADVTGVSSRKKGMLTVILTVHGQGTVLGEVEVNQTTPQIIDAWFRKRIGLGSVRTNGQPSASLGALPPAPTLTSELEKLANMYREGVLTENEFKEAKSKLLNAK